MKSICITGIGGYLGLATAYALVKAGYMVVGIGTQPERPETLPEGVIYASIDIRDESALTKFFKEHNVGTVYHFAGIKYVGKCEAEPELCYSINTAGTEAVLTAMVDAQVPHIMYASTYAVYDWSGDDVHLDEKTPTKPQTVYGKSKLQSEKLIIDYAIRGLIESYHILRYANIVGAIPELKTHTQQSFLDKIVLSTKTGETIELSGDDYATDDGTVARDFIDIRDVVRAHLLVLEATESGIYTISSAKAMTLKTLIKCAEQVSNTAITVEIAASNNNEPSSITIHHQAITESLGWKPQYSLVETVELLHQRLTT